MEMDSELGNCDFVEQMTTETCIWTMITKYGFILKAIIIYYIARQPYISWFLLIYYFIISMFQHVMINFSDKIYLPFICAKTCLINTLPGSTCLLFRVYFDTYRIFWFTCIDFRNVPVRYFKLTIFAPGFVLENYHCLDRTPGSLLPRWRTENRREVGANSFIIYKCYSELITSIDQTC